MGVARHLVRPFLAALTVAFVALLGAYVVGQTQTSGHPIDWGDFITRSGPLVVGLAGILLAGYQAWLSDHDRADARKAEFQQRLYDKQLEAYFDLYVAMGQLENEAIQRLTIELGTTKGKVPMSPDRRFALRGELMPAWRQFAVAREKWALVIPSRVATEINHFESVLLAITAPPGKSAKHYPQDLVTHVDPSLRVATAYTAAVRTMREAVGTDPLSDAMLKAMAPKWDHPVSPDGAE